MIVLALNSGSSSLKVAAFDGERKVASASIAGVVDHAIALDEALAKIAVKVDAVGHRVVHGGPHHMTPERVTSALLSELGDLSELAPLHMPPAIAAMQAVTKKMSGIPQVVCFDTAFHATMPAIAWRLAVPSKYGVRRYGFHGLSYEYIVSSFGAAVPERMIIAHLGSGSSLVAVRAGKSIDTTMGLTPGGGIPMGTRSGDLDPGVLFYLSRKFGLGNDQLEAMAEKESGLLAIGGTNDMVRLLASSSPEAKLAIDVFAYSIRKVIGSYAAALGGLDMLVFTGGIGENSPRIRADACRGLDVFGIDIDPLKNEEGGDIGVGRCGIRVVRTDEDLVIARHTRAVLTPS